MQYLKVEEDTLLVAPVFEDKNNVAIFEKQGTKD